MKNKPNFKLLSFAIVVSALALFIGIFTVEAARTDSKWNDFGTYIASVFTEGRNILISGANKYLNFGTISGSSGYGFRDNGGTIEYKSNGGSWQAVGSGGGGSVSIGSTGQIPFSNASGTDFDYSSKLLFDNTNSQFRVNATPSFATSHFQIGQAGIGTYPTSAYPGGTNTYLVMDKGGDTSDATIVMRDRGNARIEMGLFDYDKFLIKTITGNYGSEVFTTRLGIDPTTGYVGIGTEAPSSLLEVKKDDIANRVALRVTNSSASGTDGAVLQLVGEKNNKILYLGTDAGLNGGKSAFLNWGGFGTGLFMDGSGNVAVNGTTINSGIDFTAPNIEIDSAVVNDIKAPSGQTYMVTIGDDGLLSSSAISGGGGSSTPWSVISGGIEYTGGKINVTDANATSTFAGNVKIEGNLEVEGDVNGLGIAALIVAILALAASVKRAPRVSTVTTTATLTPNYNTAENFYITAQAGALTIATPTNMVAGSTINIIIKDNNTARAITWNANYKPAVGQALPTTTTTGQKTQAVIHYDGSSYLISTSNHIV